MSNLPGGYPGKRKKKAPPPPPPRRVKPKHFLEIVRESKTPGDTTDVNEVEIAEKEDEQTTVEKERTEDSTPQSVPTKRFLQHFIRVLPMTTEQEQGEKIGGQPQQPFKSGAQQRMSNEVIPPTKKKSLISEVYQKNEQEESIKEDSKEEEIVTQRTETLNNNNRPVEDDNEEPIIPEVKEIEDKGEEEEVVGEKEEKEAQEDDEKRKTVIKRERFNSLLLSQSLGNVWGGEYIFRSKIYFKKKKSLARKKWKEYFCFLTKKRHLDFYESLGGEKVFMQDLDGAMYKKCPNLVVEMRFEYPKETRVLFRCPTNVLFNEWITYFNILGVEEESPKRIPLLDLFNKWDEEDCDFFYRRDTKKWSSKDVQEFLKHVRLSYAYTSFDRYSDMFEDYDGKKMWSEFLEEGIDIKEKLAILGIRDELHLEIIRRQMERLRLTSYFDITPYVVQNKMEAMFVKKMGQIDKPFPAFLNYCKHFHRVDLIQKTLKHILTKYDEVKFGSKRYKVKFIMTENLQNWRSKQLRKLMGVPLSMANKVGLTDVQFGMFHAAFAIGPLQMEWVDNSLVLIRSISSEKVLICVDIGYYDVQNLDEFSEKMALEVIKWNKLYLYDTMNLNKKKYHANCQQFVVYFISGVLGLELKFSNAIENYLKTMKDFGKDHMVFSFKPDFAKEVSLGKKYSSSPFVPKNHKELDVFVHMILKNCPDFPVKHPSKWDLLRGFDRAFWMKYFHVFKLMLKKNGRADNEMELNYECEYTQCEEGCPFNIIQWNDHE